MNDLTLPQLNPDPQKPRSRRGPLRAVVLIVVNLLIIAHIIHWQVFGATLSPVEPSESSHALREGVINTGLVFFALALLSTLLFGRFLCGWLCHLVALQDLCAWMLNRVGIRPKPFRSRLLLWAPLGFAIFLFVWQPLAPRLFDGAPVIPKEGIQTAFITEDFWGTFPPLAIAIPFIAVCGFVTIYFLGAKGFCTYACPYGGFFAPLDRAAPLRIKVDPDKCQGTGHCTAVCTSNVRVHQEVADYGMVIDPGCMKCTDCISACPNDALSLGMAKPPLFTRTPAPSSTPRKLSWTEEAVATVTLLAVFLACFRAYGPDLFPMLFAAGIAACAAPMGVAFWNLWRKDNLRFAQRQLKRSGRWTRVGVVFGILGFLLIGLVVHTSIVNYHRWRVDSAFRTFIEIGVPADAFLDPEAPSIPDRQREVMEAAIADAQRIAPISAGGIGLFPNERAAGRAAVMRLALGDLNGALADFQRIDASTKPDDQRTTMIARLLLATGQPSEALSLLTDRLANNPEFWGSRELYIRMLLANRRPDEAITSTQSALDRIDRSWKTREARSRTLGQLAGVHRALGNGASALEAAKSAVEIDPEGLFVGELYASLLAQVAQDREGALAEMQRIAALHPRATPTWFRLAQLAQSMGEDEIARNAAEQVLKNENGSDEAQRLVAPFIDR